MTSYTTLVSLSNSLNQILNPERSYFPFDKLQIQSLDQRLNDLQAFLRDNLRNNSEAFRNLEAAIREAAWEAENVIESHIYSLLVQDGAVNLGSYKDFSEAVESLIAKMDSVVEMTKNEAVVAAPLSPFPVAAGSSSNSSIPTSKKTAVAGRDAELEEIKDRLFSQKSALQLLPIVGMGGAGKTTLARMIYDHPQIIKHFSTRAWVTVSQNYEVVEILQELLRGLSNSVLIETNDEDKSREILYKTLKKCKRYLIVVDDVWDNHVWDGIKSCFPDDGNGGCILFTSRLKEVAEYVNPEGHHHKINLLSTDASWTLFRDTVFGGGICPPELEGLGRKIVQRCDGLPLAIVVIGGLLSKEEMTRDFWDHVGQNVSLFANENDDQFSQVFLLSYNYLPQHLKACFLYMGCFREDYRIHVSRLIRLWVAEGLIQPDPDGSKSLEEVAEQYLEDLIDRNLILANARRSDGRGTKICSLHDVLREVCLKIGQKEKFLYVIERSNNLHNKVDTYGNTRLVTHGHGIVDPLGFVRIPGSYGLRARSLLCFSGINYYHPPMLPVHLSSFKLLRILDVADKSDMVLKLESIMNLVNLRYLAFYLGSNRIPSSISLLWNLQTLIVYHANGAVQIPSEIWEMPQLRHAKFKEALLPNPVADKSLILRNIQTLSGVVNLRCSMEVIETIPNVKKLALYYESTYPVVDPSHYHLQNLLHFCNLETLKISCSYFLFCHSNVGSLLSFPQSLRNLTLLQSMIPWEDMMTIIGSLPNLEVLKLKFQACTGQMWEPKEGQFSQLEYLLLDWLDDLEQWEAEYNHFPSLRHLIIRRCKKLKEIPSSVGDIPTLETIELINCSSSAKKSLELIKEQQRDYGNDILQVQILHHDGNDDDNDNNDDDEYSSDSVNESEDTS